MPTLQLRRISLFWFQGAWELGRVFGGELFCLFVTAVVCLFVCFFQLPRWVIILFFKSHKWVRFSCFVCFCFVLFCFVLFCFVLFCFVLFCFCFVLFFLQNAQFPHHNLGSGWYFFLSRRLIKFFAFFYFCLFVCLYFILFFFFFFFFFFASKNSIPLDIKWCALILILLHRWWWTLRHRQFWITVQFSEKSNSNLKLY